MATLSGDDGGEVTISEFPHDTRALDEMLSRPREATVKALVTCPGDIVILGAGGKMGPTLAAMTRRAALDADERLGVPPRSVIAVSRWSSAQAERDLRAQGVETLAADLLDRAAVADLPDADNVIFMAGQKFGTSEAPARTWAMNVLVPAYCVERYSGARTVAFSTGNVYPLSRVDGGGSRESDSPSPAGDYAASCLGRERMFEHAASRWQTPVSILRLNYAIDLRYGVLVDLAVRVQRGEPIDLAMGYVNVIWQGDANRVAIEALPRASAPPYVVNVTGAETLSVRELAAALGRRLGREAVLAGSEAPDALLSHTGRLREDFEPAATSVEWMLDAVAGWVGSGHKLLGKATRFEERGGRF
jgi:nucleoside-diphosphate-sugar epimerase